MSASVRNVKGLKLDHIDINTNYFTIHETKETREPKRTKPIIKVYHYNGEYDALNNPKICPRLLPEHLELFI